jgi:biotin operon repressor
MFKKPLEANSHQHIKQASNEGYQLENIEQASNEGYQLENTEQASNEGYQLENTPNKLATRVTNLRI